MGSILPTLMPPTSPPPSPHRDFGEISILLNGVLTGVGSVYVSTHSVSATVASAVTAIAVASIVLLPRRKKNCESPSQPDRFPGLRY